MMLNQNTRKVRHAAPFTWGLVLVLSIFAGYVAAIGKITYAVPVLAALGAVLFLRLKPSIHFFVFASLPFLALLQTPSLRLPLGIPPLVWILGLLVFAAISTHWAQGIKRQAQRFEFGAYLPLLILTIGALWAALLTSEMSRWFAFPLPFLLYFFLAKNFIKSKADVRQIIWAVYLSILAYFLLVVLMRTFGTVEVEAKYLADWRWFGKGEAITWGPLYFVIYSIEFATVAGLGAILAFYFLLQSETSRAVRWLALASLLVFAVTLAQTAARGATIAALVSIVGLSTFMRHRSVFWFLLLLAAGIFIVLFQDVLISMIPWQIAARFGELQSGVSGVGTFQYRLNVMTITLQEFPRHPMGIGYSYLWDQYHLDETIMYSSIINGTGWLGALGFFLWVIQLAGKFSSSLGRNESVLGAMVLLFVMLNGVSSSSVLLEAVISFMFWATLIVTYAAASLPKQG